MKKIYRIKHIPTGLYYTPTASSSTGRNLHNVGKIYSKKPSVNNICFPILWDNSWIKNKKDFQIYECVVCDERLVE